MRHLRTLLTSLVLLVAGGAVLYAATDRLQAFTTAAARRLAVREHPVTLPDVALETAAGARIRLADLRGRWLLVDFVYTRCPTLCTALGSAYAQLQQRLSSELSGGRLDLVSISFDPAHDAPVTLAAWLERSGRRDAHWIAARPTAAGDLDALTRAVGVTVIPDGLGGYTHNAGLALGDPRGLLVDLDAADDPERIAQSLHAGRGS
jgi:protein SCO1/2